MKSIIAKSFNAAEFGEEYAKEFEKALHESHEAKEHSYIDASEDGGEDDYDLSKNEDKSEFSHYEFDSEYERDYSDFDYSDYD